ncbi:phosphoribosyl-ATP diphosphatase [Brachybacterium sacelli]|nr:phosphoribosyl-ATP diphosphatase [Brachybacterium sacelli]
MFAVLTEKAHARPEGSGTVRELDGVVHQIGKRFVVRAAEVRMACEDESKDDAAMEISQLLHHLQVKMVAKNISLANVFRQH